MSHSVSRHLRLAIDDYDETIRRYIPAYDEMCDEAISVLLAKPRLERVVDLGSGTGSLAGRLLERHPGVVVELWDIDSEMLDVARERLASYGERAVFRNASFDDDFGRVDGMMAALALHHVREYDAKKRLYQRIAKALSPGGLLVNADAVVNTDPELSKLAYARWTEHMGQGGISPPRAQQHFEEWAEEDRYFSLDEEMSALCAAGLAVDCPWRKVPMAVVVARKP